LELDGRKELRLVDPTRDGTQVPFGWTAYRSIKTVFEMLNDEVETLMAAENLSRREAQGEQLRRAVAALDQVQNSKERWVPAGCVLVVALALAWIWSQFARPANECERHQLQALGSECDEADVIASAALLAKNLSVSEWRIAMRGAARATVLRSFNRKLAAEKAKKVQSWSIPASRFTTPLSRIARCVRSAFAALISGKIMEKRRLNRRQRLALRHK
jgi:hypothetical protein